MRVALGDHDAEATASPVELRQLALELEESLIERECQFSHPDWRYVDGLRALACKIERGGHKPTDLLSFEQVVAWFDVAPRTVERMRLSWSRPTRGKLRRILFRDLLAHVERRKE